MPSRRSLAAALALAFAGVCPSAFAQATSSALPPSVKAVVRPDLTVTIDTTGSGFPNAFTVKNVGNADSKVCVLKVTAAYVPPPVTPPPTTPWGPCPPLVPKEQCDALLKMLGALVSDGNVIDGKAACGEPFSEVVEAVPVLKPGESKTFTRGTGAPVLVIPGAVRPVAAGQVTHIRKCAPTLVCAYDVTARVDASNDNEELTKANNVATRRATREIHLQ